jgi:hypothetical protein
MTTNNQVVISRIQHRRGRKENLPQPLRPGELALTTDDGELWIGGDPDQPPYGVRTYGSVGTGAETIVDTQIAFALFSSPLTQSEFDSLVLYLTTAPSPAVVLTVDDILWDDASVVFITADTGVDAANTIANVLLAVQASSYGTYQNGSALGNLQYDGTPIDTIAAQDQTDFDGVGTNGTWTPGGGGGTTPYAPADTITMIDGTVVTVGTVTAGAVDTFTITTATTSPGITTTLTQQSTSGSGAGFELILGTANYTESVTSAFVVQPDGYYAFITGFDNALQGSNAATLINAVYAGPLVVTLVNIQIPTSGASVGSPTFRDMTVTDTDSGFTWAATGTASADSTVDELTFVSGAGINIDVDTTSDAIRITGTGTTTFAGLTDTNLTGQATGDLVFNSDGTIWTDTAGALQWDGTNILTVVDTITSGAATASNLLVAAGPLLAGASVSNGGDLTLEGGYSTTGFGGTVNINGGDVSAGTNLGGDVSIAAGASADNDGGWVTIYGGAGGQFDGGGSVEIIAGSPTGSLLYDNAFGGDVAMKAGAGGDFGGYADMWSGDGILTAGEVSILGGNVSDKVNGDDGGNVFIYGGNGGANGSALFNGRVKIVGGTSTDWPGSGVDINGGNTALSVASTVDGPPVYITGGTGRGGAEAGTIGGWVEIAGGECVGDIGGDVVLMGGVGNTINGTVRIRPASASGQEPAHGTADSGLNIAVFGDVPNSTSTIYDVNGTAPLLEFFGDGTGSGDYLRLTAGNPGVADPILEAVGSGTNIGINLRTKGTGLVTVLGTTNYETNVTADDDIPNKKYVDDAITSPTTTGNALLTAYTLTASTAVFADVTGFEFDIDAAADIIFVDYSLNIGGAVAGANNYTAIGTLKIIANTLVNSGEATLVDDQTELRDTGLTGAVAFQATFVAGSPNKVKVQYTNTFTTNATLRVSTKQWMSY